MRRDYSCFAEPLEDTELQGWISNARDWVDTLRESGQAVTGHLRLRAVIVVPELDTDREAVESPLLDLTQIAVSWDDEMTLSMDDPGTLISDEATVALLRQERERVLAGVYADFVGANHLYLPVRSGGVLHYVYYRDTIPLEDGNGLIRPY